MEHNQLPDLPRLLSLRQVCGRNGITSLSRSTIWNLVRRDGFPKPVRCSPNRTAFYEHEVRAWLDHLPRAALAEAV